MTDSEIGQARRNRRSSHRLSSSALDAILIAIGALLVYFIASRLDAFDLLAEFVLEHEDWELDEIIVAVFVAGVAGFLYAHRRYLERRREVARRRVAEGEARRLAYTDSLTDLPNRRSFVARINSAVQHAGRTSRPFAILILDLDRFKHVNDLHGHGAGDAVLVWVAERLADMLAADDTAARLGGDEFAIIARSVQTSDDASQLAMRLVSGLGQPVAIGNVTVEIGVSIGISMFPKDGGDQSSIMRRADIALFRAKHDGRGDYRFFEPWMDQLIGHRAAIEAALKTAIKEERVGLAYQPLFDLRRERLVGFEALARWTDPDLGEVPPQTFIGVAEDAGLITSLSEQLLRRAATVAAGWPADVMLSFNISPAQLRDRSLGLRIVQILGETGLPPHRLELEITEGAIVKDYESARRILSDLQSVGIHIALDDFGTGYSTLAQLSKFRFDRIKIDRSFIERATDKEQAALIRAMIGLAKGLGITTTAEGIENAQQLSFLGAEGCDTGQGFLLGRPVSAEETKRLVRPEGMAMLPKEVQPRPAAAAL